ncbi:hypothetical protein MMG00_10620 [Ignatzschineria rhizosphaerae]|uniref:Phage tail protein n=1 Tax=Ignatzschineria rhizosphaerae TaxID=2923279 RepID=A0ABY3X3R0_9GAMM|nr:hypothetical protein [Ignatzschineria rhizosphaerae]UNM95662.1 hypothetical protein MMG00_10620 [Ignatzschineria rhizosphaerae]
MTSIAKKPKVELYVGGSIYTGWKGVEIFLDLEMIAHYTSLQCAFTEDDGVIIKNGEACEVKIDDELVLTGYIDRTEYSVEADQWDLRVEIRSKTADLVDCSAGYSQIKDRSAHAVAEEVCKPFGIDVKWESEKTPKQITWKIEPMDTCFDVLMMIANECNLILTTNPEGNVVFTDAGTENIGTINLGKEILSLSVVNDWTDRFSDYICVGDNQSYRDDWLGGKETVVKKGNIRTTIKDEEINRYRPTMLMTDDVASGENTKELAEFERDRSISLGKVITTRVQSWKHLLGLWDINKRLNVNASPIIIAEDWLLTSVTLLLNHDDGYVTEMTLSPPEGFGSKMYGVQSPSKSSGSGKPGWL